MEMEEFLPSIKGGNKLAVFINSRSKKLTKKATLNAGYFEDAVYPDGTPVAEVAATQNYGAPSVGIPPRPFLSNTVAKHKKDWVVEMRAALKANDYDAEAAMHVMGAIVVEDIRNEILLTNEPPLSPVTLMLRRMKQENPDMKVSRRTVAEARKRVILGESTGGVSSKPLMWSDTLYNSTDYRVVK